MRHYKARQRKDGKWDYTVNLGNYIVPIGYCCKYREWTEEDLMNVGMGGKPENHPSIVKEKEFIHKHHDCGHNTPEEAQKCYRDYLLDQELRLMIVRNDAQHKCAKCGEWTQHYAEIDMRCFDLCEKHNNRQEVESLFESVGETWSS
jgi:hypothetical protein